jgi:hypothetical protein
MSGEPGELAAGGSSRAVRSASLAVLGIGAVAAAALVDRPLGLGATVVGCALLAVAALAAARRDAWSIVWWLAAAALATVATVRAAGWIVWPSLVAATMFGSLAAAGGAGWWALAVGLTRVARLDAGIVTVARAPRALTPKHGWRPPLVGAGLGVVLLGTFLPLFATADAAFAHLLGELVPEQAFDSTAARVATWLAVASIGGALLWTGRAAPAGMVPPPRARLARVEWVLPLSALVTLFAAFVVIQLATLYAGHDYVLETAGLTYAEYAREGFAQLLAAAALTLGVIAAAVRWAPASRLKHALLGGLCLLTLVVLASALTRLGLYMDAYGFTRLRLTAHATILWLGAVFVLIVVAGAARRTGWLPRGALAVTAAALLAFAVSNPDRRIAERNIDRYERTGRIDIRVLRRLGPDAAPALVRLPATMAACATRRMRADLAEPDGLAALNAGRARARAALARMQPAACR